MDWEKGLPLDVLALVARAGGGPKNTSGMRATCKTWEHGFELGVRGIKIGLRGPLPPSEEASSPRSAAPNPTASRPAAPCCAALRFPMLRSLDLGESRADEAWLETLSRFPRLEALTLGHRGSVRSGASLFSRLSDNGLRRLGEIPLPRLAHLDLRRCRKLTEAGLEHLRKLPLTRLNLQGCEGVGSLAPLHGLPLTSLSLEDCFQLAPADLGHLRGAPLAHLNLGYCTGLLNEEGLAQLRNLPLTSLNLDSYSENDLDFLGENAGGRAGGSLEALAGLPITELSLRNWGQASGDTAVTLYPGLLH